MDILYYIGGGSMHNNNELRYSLRSLQKHCRDLGKVWVVGNKPDFLQNVEYVWLEDKDGWWKNAFSKTMKAIESGISDKFLLMNDDFICWMILRQKPIRHITAGKYRKRRLILIKKLLSTLPACLNLWTSRPNTTVFTAR